MSWKTARRDRVEHWVPPENDGLALCGTRVRSSLPRSASGARCQRCGNVLSLERAERA